MKERYDTYCGLYCGACGVLVGRHQGRLKEIADWFELPEKDVICYGCKSEQCAAFCTECPIKKCAIEKGLESCHECDDYPCQTLKDFRHDEATHHSVVLKNLERMKEIGLEAWLSEQEIRWQCPRCGTRYSWYTQNCSDCGRQVYNAKKEEEDLE